MPETFYQWQFLGHQMDTLFGLLESQKLKKDILKINTSLAALGALTHRLQHLTACFIQNGRRGLERG